MFVGYLTMAMKITPNLERAMSFAGEQLDGRMGQELKKTLLEGHMRVHSGAEEALSKFSQRWERSCPELKRSVKLIRSSMNERSKTSRGQSLDRALRLILDGALERMRDFASSLHLPTLVIYSMGVLLPLVFVVILPVLSVINVRLGPAHLFSIYCIVLPALVYALSKRVLSKRPTTLQPPKIPAEPVRFGVFLIVIALSLPLPALALSLGAPPDVGALAALWGLTLGVVAYLHLTSARAFRQREEIIHMEEEFCDALMQLGNRVSEGRPAEDALERAAETMNRSEFAGVLERTSTNIKLGGMGLRAALFDDEQGALKRVHSSMICGTLRMFVDMIERSTRAAGEAILRAGEHLRELKGVEREIRRLMGEVVTSMRSVALFFAPFVASIAARMQGVLTSKTSSTGFLESAEISPPAFLFVLGLYIIILTVILVNYAVEIELGEDRIAKRVAIASALPVALGVFTAGAILGGQMFSVLGIR